MPADLDGVIQKISTLQLRRGAQSSPSKALSLASNLFTDLGGEPLLVLAHNGASNDSIVETIEALNAVKLVRGRLYAIAGQAEPNSSSVAALVGYTEKRDRVYAGSRDWDHFKESLDKGVKRCGAERNTGQARSPRYRLHRHCNRTADMLVLLDASESNARFIAGDKELVASVFDSLDSASLFASQLRVGVISFAGSPQLVLPLVHLGDKGELMQAVLAVNAHASRRGTKLDAAVEMALRELSTRGRKDADKIILLITDGFAESTWSSAHLTRQLMEKAGVEVHATTTSDDYGADALRIYAESVFVGRSQAELVSALSAKLQRCDNGGEEHPDALTEVDSELDQNDECRNTHLVLLLDRRIQTTAERIRRPFHRQISLLVNLLERLNQLEINQQRKIRVSIVSVGVNGATVELERISLSAVSLVLLINHLRAIKPIGDESNAPLASRVISTLEGIRERGIRQLIAAVWSADAPNEPSEWASVLADGESEVFNVVLDPDPMALLGYSDNWRVYADAMKFVEETASAVTNCRPATSTLRRRKNSRFLKYAGKVVASDEFVGGLEKKREGLPAVGLKARVMARQKRVHNRSRAANESVFRMPQAAASVVASNNATWKAEPLSLRHSNTRLVRGTSQHESRPTLAFLSDQCKVDLVLVIDTSQSVEGEFTRQLQFAIDLVRRLPDEDFVHRVQIAAVSFHHVAEIQIPFGTLRDKSAILEALERIKHTGGSTSIACGARFAAGEMRRSRRSDARQMVVLISDGNSQDSWANVISASNELREANTQVYAVTLSKDYSLRELEEYAGNKRIKQFLDEAEMSLMECRSPPMPAIAATTTQSSSTTTTTTTTISTITTAETTTSAMGGGSKKTAFCPTDLVDLIFILDTSTSVEKEFYAERKFAIDLVKAIPEEDFKNGRIEVALSKFNSRAGPIEFLFEIQTHGSEVLRAIEHVKHTGGQTSLVAGAKVALSEIGQAHRRASRLLVVFISDGNSQDEWPDVQRVAKQLRGTVSESRGRIYAVTLSPSYYFDELKEYTGAENDVYTDEKIGDFLKEVGHSAVECDSSVPQPTQPTGPVGKLLATKSEFARDDTIQSVPAVGDSGEAGPAQKVPDSVTDSPASSPKATCAYEKMDIILVIDASTSRERVFEHQRELALRLVERLPISADDMRVAVAVSSFTSTPTLRQSLGLGRNRGAIRRSIESIRYRGGSTLTADAVDLAVKEVQKRRRAGAVQVVVLMTDGVSQDPWEKMLESSARLKAIGAERFGVALGDRVDLRELKQYVGDDSRIYRENSTGRFLDDVLSLLNGTKECESGLVINDKNEIADFQLDRACEKRPLDLVVLFDSSDYTPDLTDPRVNMNRYLLLDLLGSLPLHEDQQLAVFSFASSPKLEHAFSDPQGGTAISKSIESIKATPGVASYAKAVRAAADYYHSKRRQRGANALMLIVGNGTTNDSIADRRDASNLIREVKGLECYAVDSGKEMDVGVLSAYTSSEQRVYNYDRNAEFAKVFTRHFNTSARCTVGGAVVAAHSDDDRTYSVPGAPIESPSIAHAVSSTTPPINTSFADASWDNSTAAQGVEEVGNASMAWQSVFKHSTKETFAAIHLTNYTL